jgi:histidinol-phosphate aminotransferase
MGRRELIEALERVKDSFNSYPLDRLAIAGAVAAFEDREYFDTTRMNIIRTRDKLTKDLQVLGFEVLPSQANFVFTRHPGRDGAELSRQLRERGILVRRFDLPRIDQFLRISIGNDDQCDGLVAALKAILED